MNAYLPPTHHSTGLREKPRRPVNSDVGLLVAMSSDRSLPIDHAVVGEDVIVNKPESAMHNRLGEIWKVKTDVERLKISMSFDGEIYNFYREELLLA